MKHMGNAFLRGGRLDTKDNANRSNLRDDFQTSDWLLPYSDIVALMVLEHQTQMHNAMTRANFTVRRAQHDHDAANSVAPDAAQELDVQIAQAAQEVVEYMLFVDEAPLTSEIKGSVIFANEFMKRGPADTQGRSLRDFDLERRLFKYPCSYLIYSSAFDTLEDSLRQQVYRQLWDVLASDSPPAQYTHLDKATRRSILEILRDSKAGLPPYWANAFHGSLDHRAPDDLRESM
jgi:hypothetical protein